MKKTIITLVCDLCGSDDQVDSHRLMVDGVGRDVEACLRCWSGVVAGLAEVYKVGHAPKVRETRTGKVLAWPGTPWRFSSHALLRMGERNVKPEDVIRTIERPEVKRPGKGLDSEVWSRNGTKVVVVPERQIIATVARTDEELAADKH